VVVVTGIVGLLLGASGVARPASDVGAGGRRAGPSQAPSAAPTAAERSAVAQARASKQRVEVVAKRSETMEVFAEPDGTFTAQLHPGPVRVRRGGGWVPVDTTLVRRADGSVVPGATVVSLAFSGGGAGPLVLLGSGRQQVSLYWPRRLPPPRLAGDTATYPEVLPGVDLRLTAGPTGFHEVLVVKTRQAARSPLLARLRFGMRSRGLSLRAGKGGTANLVDAKGRTVFASPAPAMWDAVTHHAVGRFELARDAISVLPDRRLLGDPAAVFPVSIDPDFGVPFAGWAKVFSGKAGTSYWYGGGDVEAPDTRFAGQNLGKVGRCWEDGTCNGIGTARTYVQFDIRALHGAVIVNVPNVTTGAEFNAHEIWAPACGRSGHNWAVDLEHANPFDGNLAWSRQQPSFPGAIGGPRWEAHGYANDARCASPAWIGWGVGDQVRYSNVRTDYVAFMLHADNESDQDGWKKLDGYSLLVHYDWPPNLPSNLNWSAGTNRTPCSTDVGNPDYVNNAAGPLTLRATATDPDVADNLWVLFEWKTRGGDRIDIANPGPAANGSELTATIPAGTLPDGKQVSWHAKAGDGWVESDWAPQAGSFWCQVDIDNTAPGMPTVTPDPSQQPTLGAPATFTVQANDRDVTKFRYGLTQGGTVCATSAETNASTLGGGATIKVTPLKATFWDLWVAAVDRANNVTASTNCAHYRFQVQSGRPAIAHWAMDGHRLLTAVPDSSSGHNHSGTVAIGPSQWTVGRVGDALHFDGSGGSFVAPGGGSVARTDQSFSVAAWVKLDRADGRTYAAVSEDGDRTHAFLLGYLSELGRFVFRMISQDSDAGQMIAVPANSAPPVGVWTHLTGTYDVTTQQLRLYVNGALQGTATMTTPWNATGALQIGRSHYMGGYSDYFAGSIDEVQVFDRVLSDLPYVEPGERAQRSEIDRLASPPLEEAYYSLDEGTGTKAGDLSGNYRVATVGGDATLTTAGHIGGGLQLGTARTGFAATTGPVVRTDSSYTVMAFARLRSATSNDPQTVVSQNGVNVSGFYLRYLPSHKWSAAVPTADSASSPGWQAVESSAVAQPQWTHLAMVYDAPQRQLRLYVNGELQGDPLNPLVVTVPANMVGALQIGRGQQTGLGFDGAIDEVRVLSGVLSDADIAAASGQTEARPPSLFAGAFERYGGPDWRHYVGTGPPPPGYYVEGPIGLPAPEGAPNTRMVYSCRNASGYFLDSQATCGGSGSEVLGQAGLMYTAPPADVPTIAVYRCLVLATGDHFASHDPSCESTPDKIRTELMLGYTRVYAPLVRYVEPGGAHWSTTHADLLPAGYTPEASLGYVAIGGVSSVTELWMCQDADADDEFLSTDPACEREQVLPTWYSGLVWTGPPAGVTQSRQLYACQSSTGERFESLDRFCEGGTQVRQLGYVITQF